MGHSKQLQEVKQIPGHNSCKLWKASRKVLGTPLCSLLQRKFGELSGADSRCPNAGTMALKMHPCVFKLLCTHSEDNSNVFKGSKSKFPGVQVGWGWLTWPWRWSRSMVEPKVGAQAFWCCFEATLPPSLPLPGVCPALCRSGGCCSLLGLVSYPEPQPLGAAKRWIWRCPANQLLFWACCLFCWKRRGTAGGRTLQLGRWGGWEENQEGSAWAISQQRQHMKFLQFMVCTLGFVCGKPAGVLQPASANKHHHKTRGARGLQYERQREEN